jgi:hypothetical protein
MGASATRRHFEYPDCPIAGHSADGGAQRVMQRVD